MHPVFFQSGSLTVYSYGFMTALGFLAAFWLSMDRAGQLGLSKTETADLLFVMFCFGILGARLLYAAQHPEEFTAQPLRIFFLQEGGLVWYGGFIGGAGAGILYARFRKWPALRFADLFAPAVPLAHAFGRVGCFLNGCCYGAATDGPCGILFPGHAEPRLPVQLFEAGGLLVLSATLLFISPKLKKEGSLLFLYLLSYGLLRFFLEFWRGDQTPIGLFSLAQWMSLALAAAGAVLFFMPFKKTR